MAHDTTRPAAVNAPMPPPIAGADYVVAMALKSSDRRARAAFTALATTLVPGAGCIFDFGCGPGTDAKLYASLGYSVLAYDVDPRMRETLSQECGEELHHGRVSIEAAGSYEDFLKSRSPSAGRVDLVTANFAPLNLVEDPAALFAKFDQLLAPGGRVLASVLNPYCLGDARYGWWWRNLPTLAMRGHYVVGEGRVHRRSPGCFARDADAHFRLMDVLPGCGDRPARWRRFGSQYLFLLFARS